MISYELPLGLSIIGVLMIAGSLSLTKIVAAQSSAWFILYQPLGFIIYLISAVAECSRTPFDLTECENELVAGYQTEYSSMKFGMYYLAEYAHILVVSSLAVTLFLGGWQGPFLPPVIWFLIKVFIFIFFFIWIRATFPRFRYDQLMKFGWKVLFPLSLANILITAVGLVLLSR
jgi:NADH-quinone oxidoreductase subunit H